MPWKCFVAVPSEFARRSLRRWHGGEGCPKRGYHDESVVIDAQIPRGTLLDGDDGKLWAGKTEPPEPVAGDPRWPKSCECGYVFVDGDHRQVNVDLLYAGAPDGKLYALRDLPVGAMWDAWWFCDTPDSRDRYAGPDGKAWCVMMPCRIEHIVYAPSSNGTKWAVTGTSPAITVSPSIAMAGKYHGFIQNGVITEDCDGRKFEGVPRTA